MIRKLQSINDILIKLNENNKEKLDQHILIKKILSEKNCFLKMNIDVAYSLLRNLKIPEESIKDVYVQLIDINN